MDQEKKTYKADSYFAPNKLVAILIYILILFILGVLISYLCAYIYSAVNNVSYADIKASFTMKSDEFNLLSDDRLKANAVTQGFGNLFAYILAAIGVCFFTRDELQKDLFKFKEKKKFYAWYIPLTAIVFTAACYGIDKLVALGVRSSENQIQIENIFRNGGMVPMLISTLIFAPIVEEIIYRKCIFSLCGKKIVLAYVLSVIAFTLPHMLTTTATFGEWALMSVPYILSAIMLAAIYHLSGYNVYVSLIAHVLNNLLAIILVFV